MIFTAVLWLLVWGGMFASPDSIMFFSPFRDPVGFILGIRPLFPLIAVYLCLMWLFLKRSRLMPPVRSPLAFFFLYCLVGLFASVVISPKIGTSLYWAANFLSPLMVVWVSMERENSIDHLRKILYLNSAVCVVVILSILPEALRLGIRTIPFEQSYFLPFNLGTILVNGAGRFALIVIIVSVVLIFSLKSLWRYFWILLLLPALYVITQSQSRSALLGLALVGVLFMLMQGLDWKLYILFIPLAGYLVYLSGFKWSAQESIEKLVFLTGREKTWEQGIDLLQKSPLFGNGFHADRLMLDFAHMHNSFFHALVQSGILGTIFFVGAWVAIWVIVIRKKIYIRIDEADSTDKPLLVQSILIVAFLTSRGFFESTAAFYGVDLLLFVPAMVYLYVWHKKNPQSI